MLPFCQQFQHVHPPFCLCYCHTSQSYMRCKSHKKDTYFMQPISISICPLPCLPAFLCPLRLQLRIIFFLPENSISVPFSTGVPAMNCLSFVYLECLYFPSLLKKCSHCEMISDLQKKCKNGTKNSHISFARILQMLNLLYYSLPVYLYNYFFSELFETELQTGCPFSLSISVFIS